MDGGFIGLFRLGVASGFGGLGVVLPWYQGVVLIRRGWAESKGFGIFS